MIATSDYALARNETVASRDRPALPGGKRKITAGSGRGVMYSRVPYYCILQYTVPYCTIPYPTVLLSYHTALAHETTKVWYFVPNCLFRLVSRTEKRYKSFRYDGIEAWYNSRAPALAEPDCEDFCWDGPSRYVLRWLIPARRRVEEALFVLTRGG